ncbi:MAG: hypothetical protein ABI565_05720 [Vicinamibacteria bacterium]
MAGLRIAPYLLFAAFALFASLTELAGDFSPARHPLMLTGALLSALIVAMGLFKLMTGAEGVRNWISGDVASIVRDNSYRLAWSDWGVLVTRAGSIDIKRKRLRLDTRIFLGLIPWATVDRPIDPLDRVEALHHYYENRDEDGGSSETYDHAVELHRADGEPIRLFDVTSDSYDGPAAALVDRLSTRVKAAILIAQQGPPRRPPRGAGPE